MSNYNSQHSSALFIPLKAIRNCSSEYLETSFGLMYILNLTLTLQVALKTAYKSLKQINE